MRGQWSAEGADSQEDMVVQEASAEMVVEQYAMVGNFHGMECFGQNGGVG